MANSSRVNVRQQVISDDYRKEAQYVTRRRSGVAALLLELPDYPRTTTLLDHLKGWAYLADSEGQDESFEQEYGRCLERGEYVAWMLRARTADELMRELHGRRLCSTTPPPEGAWNF